MNEIAPMHPIGAYVPMVDGPEKVSGRAKYTADVLAARHAGGAHLPQPLRARRDPRGRHRRGRQAAGRARHRHRRRLRQDLRRAAHRPQRAPAGARQGALQGRAGGGRGGHRRGHRRQGHPPHQDEGARAAGLLHRRPGHGARCRADPRQEARQSRARRELRAGQRGDGLRRGRSGVRSDLQLRRGVPEPNGDARRGRRVRRGARPHDRACLHPGALLRAPDAGPDPRHGHVEDPRHQAVRRRRLRLPHRVPQRRADCRPAGAAGGRCRAHHAHPRGHLHHPPRPARDRHPHEDRPQQGRQDHRRRVRVHPARRRALGLRRGDDPLLGLDALRPLRPAQRQVHRQARADQHAAVRRLPRPRHGRRALRLREPARPDGGRDGARSACRAPRQFPQGADLHRQRPDGEQLRPARVHRLGGEGERLGRAQGQARQRRTASAKAWALPARTTSPAPPSPSTGPASRTPPSS